MYQKTTIAVPSLTTWDAAMAVDFAQLAAYHSARGYKMGIFNPRMSANDVSMNMSVLKAREQKATHILFIDSDMQFPPNSLERLLSLNLAIVGCNARRRVPPFTPIFNKDLFGKPLTLKHGAVRKVHMIGTGVTLIRMDVFDQLTEPYFKRDLVSCSKWVGYDRYFCEKARAAGFHIYCDVELSSHIGHVAVETKFMGDL